MAKNAAVYARFGGPLAARHWQALVPPGEECLVDLAGDGSGATFVSPDGRITFRRMADDEVPQHLLGLERFLREVGGSDGLIVRALSTSAVYGAVADTELGGGMPGRLALQLADLTEGFCFVDHGRVVDGRGRDLIDEPLRPDLERVMRRAMILLATSFRSVIETAGLDDPATADEASRRLREWLDWVELREEMEDAEREFVTQPAGAVGVEYAANHAFDTEAALGLLWAVGVTELPGLDPARVPLDTVEEFRVPGPGPFDPDRPLPTLRPEAEVDQEWRRQQAVHWRLVDLRLNRRPFAFADWAADTWFGAVDLTGLELIDGDLAVGGTPVHALDDDVLGMITRQAAERHRGLNWLIGAHPIYGAVGVPT